MNYIRTLAVVLTAIALSLFSVVVFAQDGTHSLFGEAAYVDGGVQITSDSDPAYGGVDFPTPGLTIGTLDTLSTDYQFVAGTCAGGSPRFVLDLEGTDDNVFIYFGEFPTANECPASGNTGNLVSDDTMVDATQLGLGYITYGELAAAEGDLAISSIFAVVDGSWAVEGGVQTVLLDNVVINNTTYDFEEDPEVPVFTKDDCKKGGWQNFNGANGMPGPFRNQGDCVSYFSTGGRNQANG